MLAPPRPPQHDNPELLIKEARERQLRRRLFAGAGVAIAAAIGLVVYAMAGGTSADQSSHSPAAGGPPGCRSTQLSASYGPSGAAGTILGGFMIGNAGGAPCAIPAGRPAVHILLRGRPVLTREVAWPPADEFGPSAGHIIRPGAKAYFEIGWRDRFCPNATAASRPGKVTMLLSFGNGLQIAAPETEPENIPSVPGCQTNGPPPQVAISGLLRYR
jgi:hypothetical protein